jgi:hypothetical protein
MVAYNFQARFVEPIRLRHKQQTIRRNGKRRHARTGERLQLYVHQRSKQCEKILVDDPICTGAHAIEIEVGPKRIELITVGGFPIANMKQFARRDGFKDAADMHAFWLKFHGVGPFTDATLIEWREAT